MATDTSERRDSSHDEYSANAIPSGVTRSLHLQVPNIVVKFTDYLLQEAKRQVGIFRISVAVRRVIQVNSSLSNNLRPIPIQL